MLRPRKAALSPDNKCCRSTLLLTSSMTSSVAMHHGRLVCPPPSPLTRCVHLHAPCTLFFLPSPSPQRILQSSVGNIYTLLHQRLLAEHELRTQPPVPPPPPPSPLTLPAAAAKLPALCLAANGCSSSDLLHACRGLRDRLRAVVSVHRQVFTANELKTFISCRRNLHELGGRLVVVEMMGEGRVNPALSLSKEKSTRPIESKQHRFCTAWNRLAFPAHLLGHQAYYAPPPHVA